MVLFCCASFEIGFASRDGGGQDFSTVARVLEMPEALGKGSPEGGDLRCKAPPRNHVRWSMHETLVLLAAKEKKLHDAQELTPKARMVAESQKWGVIAEYCVKHGVQRDAPQCKKRWHYLYTEYKKIKDHDKLTGVTSYWMMSIESRKDRKLVPGFERQLFDLMDAFLGSLPSRASLPAVIDTSRPTEARGVLALPAATAVVQINGSSFSRNGDRCVFPSTGNLSPANGSASPLNAGALSEPQEVEDSAATTDVDELPVDSSGTRKRKRKRMSAPEEQKRVTFSDDVLTSALLESQKRLTTQMAADRELRQEQGKRLIAVFERLADGLTRIASTLEKMQEKVT